jgi:hypothetical protein
MRVVHTCVCLTLVALLPARPAAASGSLSAPVEIAACGLDSSPPPVRPAFRLGNAARPFGWSTVIGDFDRDGRPDVVVADHAAGRPTGYAYRIEFSLSGQATYDVRFESAQPAVTLTISDVDDDDDLDVLVGTAGSGEKVGIWLNDGQGHFTSTALKPIRPTVGPIQTLRTPEPPLDSSSFDVSDQRGGEALAAVSWAAASNSSHRATPSCGQRSWSAFHWLHTGPRAPPQRPRDLHS